MRSNLRAFHVAAALSWMMACAVACGGAYEPGDGDAEDEAVASDEQAIGDPARAGCADGGREGFRNGDTWKQIAGCAGRWSIPGIHTDNPGFAPACPGLPTHDTTTPACDRGAGNDGVNYEGIGCNVADLCAAGWHVCTGAAEVAAKSSTGCGGATRASDPPLFFATRQSTNGCGACSTGTSTDASCDSATCSSGCQQTAATSNDFAGCGNFGSQSPMSGCGVLDRFSHNLCSGLGGPWFCDAGAASDDNGLCEAYTVTKIGSRYGGVLCCVD